MTREGRASGFGRDFICAALIALTAFAFAGVAGAADPDDAKPEPSRAGPPAPKPPSQSTPATPGIPAPRALPIEGRPPSRDLGRALEDRGDRFPSVMISHVSYGGDCPRVGDTLTLTGRGFGDIQGRQRVVMLLGGLEPPHRMSVVSWSGARIEVRIPTGLIQPGASYVVEFRDASDRRFAAGSPVRLCQTPGKLQVLVQSNPDCTYDVSDVRVFAVAEDGHRTELGPPTGGFRPPGLKEARLPLGEYELTGELAGGHPTCPGLPFTGWSSNPERIVLTNSRPLGEATLRYGARNPIPDEWLPGGGGIPDGVALP